MDVFDDSFLRRMSCGESVSEVLEGNQPLYASVDQQEVDFISEALVQQKFVAAARAHGSGVMGLSTRTSQHKLSSHSSAHGGRERRWQSSFEGTDRRFFFSPGSTVHNLKASLFKDSRREGTLSPQ